MHSSAEQQELPLSKTTVPAFSETNALSGAYALQYGGGRRVADENPWRYSLKLSTPMESTAEFSTGAVSYLPRSEILPLASGTYEYDNQYKASSSSVGI